MKMDPFKNGNEKDRAIETWLFKFTTVPTAYTVYILYSKQHENNRK